MRIILARPRGFCAGVRMAIASLQRALEDYGAPVYAYHEIVHNEHVVDSFRRRGVIFVNQIEQVPERAHVLYSAHGVAPEIRRRVQVRRIRPIDATCPLVKKVHKEAVRFAREGYFIVLIGHAGHDEIVGVLGEAPQQIRLIQRLEDVDSLQPPDPSRTCYLTQTTLSADDTEQIIGRLRRRFPDIVGPPTDDICYATQNRQAAVKALIRQADVALVVGSENSSNSNRLAEIARAHGRAAHLISNASAIDVGWFRGDETVLVTAGASAPEELVNQCVACLRGRFGGGVEEMGFCEENAQFPLPNELRQANVAAGPLTPAAPWPLETHTPAGGR